jgi:hypothetical protein
MRQRPHYVMSLMNGSTCSVHVIHSCRRMSNLRLPKTGKSRCTPKGNLMCEAASDFFQSETGGFRTNLDLLIIGARWSFGAETPAAVSSPLIIKHDERFDASALAALIPVSQNLFYLQPAREIGSLSDIWRARELPGVCLNSSLP